MDPQLWTGFVLGLLGSLHCLGMCGPLALALPAKSRGRMDFLAGRILYNSGRVVTYGLLGAVFGVLGKTFALAGLQQGLSIAVGVLLLVGLFIGPKLAVRLHPFTRVQAWVGRWRKAWSRLLGNPTKGSLFTIGLLNGLLPCGLVYVALAGAALAGTARGGLLYMALFGLGTFPLMLGVSLFSGMAHTLFRFRLQRLIPVAVFVLGVMFILRGMALGIPYLSPVLADGGVCCH